ncbi:MAG: acyl-CoA dehydrogenase family protein [Planctomycetes bacterium]|nr:acyl-CoA dehydrogenase family protein [Planctomycetota bacterium]
MDPFLGEENLRWQEKARKVAEEVIRPSSAKYDRLQEYPWEILNGLKQAGLFSVWIPEEYGGAGGQRILNLCIVVEELSRACGGVGVLFAVNALGSFPIIVGATEDQKKRWLPSIAKGEALMAFCLSEKGSGSDAQSMRTVARKEGNNYIVSGEKKWTTNGGPANLYTVFAVTDHISRSKRISAIVVEKGTEGFYIGKIEDKMGIRCVPVVETIFNNCRVPEDNLLGGKEGFGFKHAMATLDIARPGVAAQAIGLAQGALDLALVYVTKRRQFGQSISSFQHTQFKLAELATKIEAARNLVYKAAIATDRGLENNKLSAMCKYYATTVAMEVTTEAVQLFGGYGYMKDYPIEKYMRDAKITQIYEGTNEVQRLVIARNLLKEATKLDHLLKFIPEEKQFVTKNVGFEEGYYSVPAVGEAL